jgi:hypothetical protein
MLYAQMNFMADLRGGPRVNDYVTTKCSGALSTATRRTNYNWQPLLET